MKKRTDCDFCPDGEKHLWPHGHTSVTVQSFRFGEAISASRQGQWAGIRRNMTAPPGSKENR